VYAWSGACASTGQTPCSRRTLKQVWRNVRAAWEVTGQVCPASRSNLINGRAKLQGKSASRPKWASDHHWASPGDQSERVEGIATKVVLEGTHRRMYLRTLVERYEGTGMVRDIGDSR
jgi:hypothetical protein